MDRSLDADRLAAMTRQLDGQLRASFGTVARADLAAEVLNDSIGDGQPEAKPLPHRLGGKEWIEDPVDPVGRYAGAVVGDDDGDRVRRGASLEPHPGALAPGHRVERVA